MSRYIKGYRINEYSDETSLLCHFDLFFECPRDLYYMIYRYVNVYNSESIHTSISLF